MTHDIAKEIEKDCWGESRDDAQRPVERLVMMPPYVAPEHRQMLEKAQEAFDEYNDTNMVG